MAIKAKISAELDSFDKRTPTGRARQSASVVDMLSKVKRAIFRVLMLLSLEDGGDDRRLDERVMNGRWQVGLATIWQCMQLLSFPFSSVFRFPWNYRSTHWLIKILSLTRFDLLLVGNQFTDEVPRVANIVLCAFIFTWMATLVYTAYMLHKKAAGGGRQAQIMVRPLWAPLVNLLTRLICGPLYIPIMGVLFTNLRCVESVDHQCWNGEEAGMAVGAVILAAFVFMMSLAVNGVVINNDVTSHCAGAKAHGRADMAIVLAQTVLVFMFSVLHDNSALSLWTLTVTTAVCAVFMLYYEWTTHPHFRPWAEEMVTSSLAVFVWSATCLVVAKIIDDRDQTAATLLFLIGSVGVATLARLCVREQIDRTSAATMDQLRSVYDCDLKFRLMLEQFATSLAHQEQQQQQLEDAIGGDDYAAVDNTDRQQLLFNNNATVEELLACVRTAVHKFSHEPLVYIFQSYALTRLGNDHVAYVALLACEDAGAPLDADFLIFKSRYRMELKVIGDEVSRNILRYVGATQSMVAAKRLIHRAAFLKYNFWTELSADFPNVDRLNELGGQINETVSNAHVKLREVMTVNRDSPTLMREYGNFLIRFLNDQAAGQAMLDRADEVDARKQENMTRGDNMSMSLRDASCMYDERTAVIMLGGGGGVQLGKIMNVNLAAEDMFGRAEPDMVDNDLSSIMPPPLCNYYNELMHKHYVTGDASILGETQKSFGVHKSGFIFPIQMNIRQLAGGLVAPVYIAVMRQENTVETEHTALVSCEAPYPVLRCTAGWSRFFGHMLHDIVLSRCNLSDLFADWQTNNDGGNYHDQGGKVIEFTASRHGGKCLLQVSARRMIVDGTSVDVVHVVEKQQLRQQHQQQTFDYEYKTTTDSNNIHDGDGDDDGDGADNDSMTGFGSEDDLVIEEGDETLMSDDDQPRSPPPMMMSSSGNNSNNNNNNNECKLQVDVLLPPVGGFSSHNNSPLNADNGNNTVTTTIAANKTLPTAMKKKKRAAKAVRIRHDADTASVGGKSRRSAKSGATSNGGRNDWRAGLMRIRSLFLNQSDTLEPAMVKLRTTLLIVIVGICMMSVLVAVLVMSSMTTYKDNVGLLNVAGSRRQDLVTVAQSVRAIDLMRRGLIPNTREQWHRQRIESAASRLWTVQTDLFLQKSAVLDEHRDLYEKRTIPVEYITQKDAGGHVHVIDTATRNVNLIEGLNEFQSAARQLVRQPLGMYNSSQYNTYFIRKNLDMFVDKVNTSCNFYEQSTIEEANKITVMQYILLVVTLTCMLALVAAFIVPAVSGVESMRRDIFSMFVADVPLPMLKRIRKEAFTHLSDEDKVVEGAMDGNGGGHDGGSSGGLSRRQKKHRRSLSQTQAIEMEKLPSPSAAGTSTPAVATVGGDVSVTIERTQRHRDAFHFSSKNKYRLFCHIGLVVIVAIVYFLGTFFWEKDVLESSVRQVPEMNGADRIRLTSRRAIYKAREVIVQVVVKDSDFYVPTRQVRVAEAREDLRYMTDLLNGLMYGSEEMHLPGMVDRRGRQDHILFQDVCPQIFPSDSSCSAFHNGLVTHGGAAMIAQYDTELRALITYADILCGAGTVPIVMGELAQPSWADMEKLDEVYLDQTLQALADELLAQKVQEIDSFLGYRRVVLSLFVVVLLVLYVFLYAPLVRQLDVTLKRTRGLLLLIPAEYMMSIPPLANILMEAAITGKK